MEPWDDDAPDLPPPRRPGWGCLAASIVGAIGFVVVAVLALRLLSTMLSGVHLR